MKKVLVFCLALVMVFSMSMSVFAAGAFVSSPSGNKAPVVVEGECDGEECEGEVGITSYTDRDKLNAEDREIMEKAYEIISGTDDLTEIDEDIKKLAEELGIDGKDLSVSDIFHVDTEDCDHEYTITLDAETLKNFAGLVYFDGKDWKVIEGAKIVNGKLVFKTSLSGTFAVLVNNGHTPKTGDNSNIYLWVMIASGSALAVVLFGLTLKKKRV